LHQLHTLSLKQNFLSGPLCNIDFGGLTNLTTLLLGHNALEGEIPITLSKLIRLEILELQQNNLTGTLDPCLFVGWTNLRTLRLESNRLMGALPSTISNLQRCEHIILDCNGFTGHIPPMESLISLSSLSLTRNAFDGPFPPSLPPGLAHLHLSMNQLTNPIPDILYQLTHLRELHMSFNAFPTDETTQAAIKARLPRCRVVW